MDKKRFRKYRADLLKKAKPLLNGGKDLSILINTLLLEAARNGLGCIENRGEQNGDEKLRMFLREMYRYLSEQTYF